MLKKEIIWFGKNAVLCCDGKCNKAWGMNNRPKNQLSDNEDDYEYLADHELDDAPVDPGTYECDHAKPTVVGLGLRARLNKWCARECERSVIAVGDEAIKLPDLSKRYPNIKR